MSMSLITVSVDIKQHWTMLRHWSKFVPNMSTDIQGHEALHHHHHHPQKVQGWKAHPGTHSDPQVVLGLLNSLNCCMSTLHLIHYALFLTPTCWKSNNTNTRLMAFAPSLALNPTFGIWSLPQDLRHCSTLSSFKAKLKTFLFSQYFHPN